MNQTNYETSGNFKIKASIVDEIDGMRVFENVKMIRVMSRDHNLLIMEDFMPVIGKVTRSVELVFENETVKLSPIQGFYMHKKNEFYLLIDNHNEEERPGNEDDTEE